MRRYVIIGTLLLAACGGGSKAASTTTAPTHTISGSVAFGIPYSGDVRACEGRAGHDDLVSGAVVDVTNEAGTTIATGKLAEGKASLDRICTMPLVVDAVPAAKFYGIGVGHRAPVKFSAADLEAKGWKVTLTLD